MRKIIFGIFLLGFLVRILSVVPSNTIIGFDQARDLFASITIYRDHDLKIIGPTAGNNPNLHHGVLFWYYLVVPLFVSGGSPIAAVIWNLLFNAFGIIVLYYLARDIFKSKKAGIIAATVTAFSYYYVQFGGWLSNPTGTFFTLPLFFYGIWKYYEGKKWGLPLAFLFLGLTIQFELFFVYLIPTGIIAWIILRPKWPSLKLLFFSVFTFMAATSTMIATEIKFHFEGIKSILFAGNFVGGGNVGIVDLLKDFVTKRWETFYLNFWPQNKDFGTLLGMIAVGFLIYELFKKKEFRKRNYFLLLWFLSPAIMFILGQHNAPWFYIGRPAAAILIGSYVISKIKPNILIFLILVFIILANVFAISDSYNRGQVLLEPDRAGIVYDQLRAVDYTYKSSSGSPFEINTLTNPLYINAVWGYHYYWYGNRTYGYMPTFAGGVQNYPYNTLSVPKGNEKYLYLIMDTSNRIPPQYKNEIIGWANKVSRLEEEKQFGGIDVQKRIVIVKK